MAAEVVDVLLRARADVSQVSGSFKDLQKQLENLSLPKGVSDNLEKSFTKLTPLIKDYQKQLNKGFSTQKDLKNFEILREKIDNVFSEIETEIGQVNNKEVRLKVDIQALNDLKKKLSESKADIDKYSNEIFKVDHPKEDVKRSMQSLQDALNNTFKTGKLRFPALSEIGNELKKAFNTKDYAGFNNIIDSLKNKILSLSEAGRRDIARSLGLKEAEKDIKSVDKALIAFLNNMSLNKNAVKGFNKASEEARNLEKAIKDVETQSVTNGIKGIESAAGGLNTVREQFRAIGEEATEAGKGSVRMAEEFKQLQQSTQYFFSLRNMINLLKRGIREAVDVVKELDAAMTETAVVTDYSVGDMWQKLPEYTANANALGATVKDMYEATTLYYQQGLRTEAAMGIANETMKMARIGGLEAKDATDKMTAALRGFNMEINEMSAQRVNDVYSNLAAKTASDTEELGTAMQRTASIAHSAGMSFEGTAAFLAQAIETTREPAENLGTAMKTIVARFTELKKNPLEIAEVDGEEVSYNKVDTALQSIGVSLKDANGQFRDLDKVFLDISKRWDSLTQTQQRYVATTAAGSRQQSRFIAMMSNYERTMQLMDFANNSAGASNEQFGKTMESLEAKLNKLKNAWNEFLMGIMNDSLIKKLVDGTTTIIDQVNKLLDALSFNGELGLVKSLLSIGTAGVALKAGGNILNKLIGGVGGFIDPTSSFRKGFWGAGQTTAEGVPTTGVAGKITAPIVAKLNELIGVAKTAANIKDKTLPNTTSTLSQYKNTTAMLRNTKSLNMKDIGGLFGSLSNEHAYAAYKNTPGTADAMKQAALGWLASKKMPADAQKTGQQLMNAIFKGMSKKEISIKEGMKLMGRPQLWGEYFGTNVAQSFSQNFVKAIRPEQMADARKRAAEMAWKAIGGDPHASDAIKQIQYNQKDSAFRKAFNQYYKNIRIQQKNESALDFDNIPVAQNNFQQLANKVGILGSRFSAAGMSLQMFGSQLGQLSPALQGVGALLSQVGMAVNTFGMGISGIGSTVVKTVGRFSEAAGAAKAASAAGLTAKTTANVFLGTLTEGLSAGAIGGILGVALVGGLMIAKGIADKKAREAAEEVRENFEKGFTETSQKIDSLEGYKDRFTELAQGVDRFGHNINLSDEDYDEYLSISRELQELSPSLIAGYNAEGQAILKKGAALNEVIDKLQQEKKIALEDYISDSSIDKLIKDFNLSDAYKSHNTMRKGDMGMGDAFDSEKSSISQAIKKAELEWSDFSQILSELGIGGADSINDLTAQQLGLISTHYNDIINKIKEFNPQIEEEAEDGLKEAFGNINGSINDVLTEGAPIIESLQQWMGHEGLDAVGLQLGEEFVSGFNSGIQGIMLEGLTNNWKPEEYKQQLRNYSNEWQHLAGETSEYSRILSEAEKIQQTYTDTIGDDGAVEKYETDIESLALKLEDLANQYQGTGSAGEVFAEQCLQQANALRNYATEGALSLGESLNTLSDEFASAREAKSRFDEAIKGGDYYTAAEGYKSIIDTILDEKNTVGNGSNGSLTFWAGADELLGQKYVDNHSADEVVNQVEKIKGCFEDGLPGVQKFGDLLVENADNLTELGKVNDNGQFEFNFKNLDDLEEYAELLGMSEDALAALIDKSRQYVPWNLSDPGQVRQSLEASTFSMSGTSSKGKNLLYTSEAEFRNEARRQGIRGDDYTKTKADVEERGVRFLTVENLTAKKSDGNGLYADQVLENIGLKGADKTLDNAVAALAKMGFDLEDTKTILTADGLKLADGTATAEEVEKSYAENAYALENPTVAGIASDTGVIASAATAMLASMGILTDQAKQDIDQATSAETTQGYIDNLNNASTNQERNQARNDMADKVAEYNALANKLVEGGRDETDPYVQKLRNAASTMQDELDKEAANWNAKAVAANEYLKNNNLLPKGATQEENLAIQAHAVDLQTAINSGDSASVIETLKLIGTEGNLSAQSMIALTNSIIDLGALDSSNTGDLLGFINTIQQKVNELEQATYKPFELTAEFETKNPEEINQYITELDDLTLNEKRILISTEFDKGADRVNAFINELNGQFGNGDEINKTVIIKAMAETANGNVENSKQILTDAFGGDKAEEIQKKVEIICDGSVVNEDEVKNGIQQSINGLQVDSEVKSNVQLNVDTSYNTTATTVPTATGAIDYNTIENQKQPDTGIAAVKYNSIAYQKPPEDKHAKVYYDKAAKGRNFSIPVNHTLSFGSAAQGMNLPKSRRHSKQEVTSLVGEEGFEIGYIPSQQRSVIFGANGPELTAFPKDTIIYPHKLSQEILRRGKGKHESLGSFAGGNTGQSGGIPTTGGGGGGGGGGNTGNRHRRGRKGSTSSTNKKKNYNNWSIEEVIRFDVDQNLERLASELKRITDDIENNLGKIGNTASQISGAVNDQLQNLKATLDYNKELADSYQRQLDELLNAKSANYKISYTQANGKSADKLINPAQYIFQNEDGTYEVDVDAIQSLTAGKNANENTNRALRESVFNEVSKILNELQSGIVKTADEIADIEKQIREAGEKISESFYRWENELTRVYDLSQRIADETSLTDRFASQIGLELSKLNIGFGDTEKAIENIRKVLARNNNTIQSQIKNQQEMIAARREELEMTLSTKEEFGKIQQYMDDTSMDEATKEATVDWARQQYMGVELGRKYVSNLVQGDDGHIEYEIDWAQFNKDQQTDPYNKETYDAIKQYLDDLNEKATEYNNSIKDQSDFLKQTYDALKEYQQYVVDAEETLIKGTEQQIEKAQDNAKQISSSITDALKDLLDEVKRKLDERRKAEDNAKTEQDISQKQQRLAALRADTAGGHQVEIAQLEKEIADAQQSYQRTLEDQLLDRLSQQADEAAKQRERQIELAEVANTIAGSTNKELVDMWLKDPVKYKEQIMAAWLEAQGFDEAGEAGQAVLLNQFEAFFAELVGAVEQSGFNSESGVFKPVLDQQGQIATDTGLLVNLVQQLVNAADGADADVTKLNTDSGTQSAGSETPDIESLHKAGVDAKAVEKLGYKLEDILKFYELSELQSSGYKVSQLTDVDNNLTIDQLKKAGYDAKDLLEVFNVRSLLDSELFTISDLKQGGATAKQFDEAQVAYKDVESLFTKEELSQAEGYKFIIDTQAAYDDFNKTRGSKKDNKTNPLGGSLDGAALKEQIARGQILGLTPYQVASKLASYKVLGWAKVMPALKAAGYDGKTVKSWNSKAGAKSAFRKQFVKTYGKWTKFEKGGLANFTGPAWLDGTPSRPELILNAKDTQNFLALRDVLSKAVSSAGSITNSYGGDAIYEININVDHIASDYDVDKVAERVKKIIVKDSGYRNVTQVRNFR